jgi:hypothetical protein
MNMWYIIIGVAILALYSNVLCWKSMEEVPKWFRIILMLLPFGIGSFCVWFLILILI